MYFLVVCAIVEWSFCIPKDVYLAKISPFFRKVNQLTLQS